MLRTPARRHRREETRGRRHHHRRHREEGSPSLASRWRHEEAERDARRRDRWRAGLEDLAEVPASSSSLTKKPRLRSEVGLVLGCPWRFDDDPFNPQEHNAAGVPAEEGVEGAPTPSSSAPAPANNCDGVIFAPDEAAPTKGGAGTASTSITTAAPPATTTGVLFACRLSVPAQPELMPAPQTLIFTGPAAAPLPLPASTPCRPSPKRMKMTIPSASRPAYAAIPAVRAFPIVAPLPPQQQEDADPDELRRAKVQRYAGLIAKKQQETTERYGSLLRIGKAPPEPPKPKPVVDEEALRIAAARKRFRKELAQEERKARGAALFVQMARPEHLRALGIDNAMERVVSPERPRDENGAPVVSPEHPCSPLEKLGYFLKVEYRSLEEDVVLAGTSG